MKELLLYLLLGINLFAFLVYGWDKRQAVKGGSRVSEKRLLLLAFFLGAPGAWAATKVFRHKTVKTSFRIKLYLVTIVEVLLIGAALWFWFKDPS